MKVVNPSVSLVNPPSYSALLSTIEQAGRTCYKSENKITPESAKKFVASIIGRGHEAVLEHGVVTVRFIVDRGVSHEIVRHRLASYCQESTRYCNYALDKFNGEISVIYPASLEPGTSAYGAWKDACRACEAAYFELLDWGCTPEQARAVLPNSLKTELVMTANIREWRHFLKLRTSYAAHPDIRYIAVRLLGLFQREYPVFFNDIIPQTPGTK